MARTRPDRREQRRAAALARAEARRECPTGKVQYATERDARIALAGAVVDFNRGRCHRKESRVYLCDKCPAWHLTSAPLTTKESGSGLVQGR